MRKLFFYTSVQQFLTCRRELVEKISSYFLTPIISFSRRSCILRSRRKFTYAEARKVGASQMLLTLPGDGGQLERFYVVNHNVARVQGSPPA